MSAPVKKRNVNISGEKSRKDGRKDSYEDHTREHTVIQVEFEGRNPIDSDFHGIKQLLSQLFLKAHVNLSELTELIIGQNYVGSVVKQGEVEDDEADEDDSDPNEVFGITTVINLTEKQKFECISQLRSLLLKLCIEHGSKEVISLVEGLLSNNDKPIGLIINERFVNIPAQIAVPLFKNLRTELRRAVEKKMAYDFSYLILICKLYKMEVSSSNKNKSVKSKCNIGSEIVWSNPEEEIVDQEAEAKFEFSVKDETDSGLIGEWDENDDEMIPMRRILLVPFNKLDLIIERVEEAVSAA